MNMRQKPSDDEPDRETDGTEPDTAEPTPSSDHEVPTLPPLPSPEGPGSAASEDPPPDDASGGAGARPPLELLRYLIKDGQVARLYAPDPDVAEGTLSGYFDVEDLEDHLEDPGLFPDRCPYVEVLLHPVNPDLYSLAPASFRPGIVGIESSQIVSRQWLVLPVLALPANDGAQASRELVLTRTQDLLTDLGGRYGWPPPLIAECEAGYVLLFRIDLPADDEGLTGRVFSTLGGLFDRDGVTIQRVAGELTASIRLLNTAAGESARSGASPDTVLRFFTCTEEPGLVSREQLEALVAHPALSGASSASDVARAQTVAHVGDTSSARDDHACLNSGICDLLFKIEERGRMVAIHDIFPVRVGPFQVPRARGARFNRNGLRRLCEQPDALFASSLWLDITVNAVRSSGGDLEPNTFDKLIGPATDQDVVDRRWLVILLRLTTTVGGADGAHDPPDITAKADEIGRHLHQRGFPEPVVGRIEDQLVMLYRLDPPPDAGILLHQVLVALADRFDDAAVKVNRDAHNAAVVLRLPGALSPDRSNSTAGPVGFYFRVPPSLQPVGRELLEAVVADVQSTEASPLKVPEGTVQPSESPSAETAVRVDPGTNSAAGVTDTSGGPAVSEDPISPPTIWELGTPTRLTDIIGQRRCVEQLTVAHSAALADGTPMTHTLMTGPPGLGKTQFAQIIANEMGTRFHRLLGETIKNPDELAQLLQRVQPGDVIFIDEAHAMRREVQEALLPVLDRRLLSGPDPGTTIRVPGFTLVLSTTDDHRLLRPLRDRMQLHLRFQFYTTEELTQLLEERVRELGWDVEAGVLSSVAERARGIPRLAIRLLNLCWQACRHNRMTTLTPVHVEEGLRLDGRSSLGLDSDEMKYLQKVAAGASQLRVIAHQMPKDPQTLLQLIEPDLIRLGLIMILHPSRRVLTERGRDHLGVSSSPPEDCAVPLIEQAMADIVRFLQGHPNGETQSVIRAHVRQKALVEAALRRLEAEGVIEKCDLRKRGGRDKQRRYDGWRLVPDVPAVVDSPG